MYLFIGNAFLYNYKYLNLSGFFFKHEAAKNKTYSVRSYTLKSKPQIGTKLCYTKTLNLDSLSVFKRSIATISIKIHPNRDV